MLKKIGKKRIRRILSLLTAISLVVIYYISGVSAADVILGDYDENGRITSYDARGILRLASRLDPPVSREKALRLDVLGDKKVSSADARHVLRTAAGLEQPKVISLSELLPPSTSAQITATQAPFAATEQTAIPANSTPTAPTLSVPSTELPVPSTELTVPNTTAIFVPNDTIGMEKPPYPEVPNYTPQPDSFVFINYGYGHGVGMSQYGAIGMARHGYNYAQILGHYYTGIALVREEIPSPTSVLYTGETVDTIELLCRVVQREIAGVTKPGDDAALQAQAVAAYTLLKSRNFRLPNKDTMAYAPSMSSVREDVIAAVRAVEGIYMTYNGQLITAPFFAYSAGVTTSASTVWGTDYPYLRPVVSYYDIEVEKYSGYRNLITVDIISAEDMARYIKNYDSSIFLAEDHTGWLQILSHDAAVSPEIGYVSAMRIGNKVLNRCAGQIFRYNILGLAIDSHCFSLIYYDENLQPHSCNAVFSSNS